MGLAKHKCRVCKSVLGNKFLSLGPTPLANSFLRPEDLDKPETFYPLDVCFCDICGLVQLGHVVPPEIMFRDYIYVSGTSTAIPAHFSLLAKEVVERFKLDKDSLVVDIGGNDGTLLRGFKNLGVRTLDIEPATNIARIAEGFGIEAVNEFWNKGTAVKVAKERGKARVIIGTNVFAHVDDWDDFLEGINALMADDGVFIIEAPYLADLIEKIQFDTIYHEHLSYLAVRPLVALFKRFGLELFDCKRLDIHGGSIRLYVKKSASGIQASGAVEELVLLEKILKLDSFNTYLDFAARVDSLRQKLLGLLGKLKAEGNRIVGYGAPAKGNTLLNYCKIGTEMVSYTVDKNSLKQGLYTPGTRIPIFPVEKLLEDSPEYVLILAWNFADEIIQQQKAFRERGGKFIIPLPEPRVI